MQSPHRKLGIGGVDQDEILISEVAMIAWMLMPFSASALNILRGNAGMAAHADADDRDLGDVASSRARSA